MCFMIGIYLWAYAPSKTFFFYFFYFFLFLFFFGGGGWGKGWGGNRDISQLLYSSLLYSTLLLLYLLLPEQNAFFGGLRKHTTTPSPSSHISQPASPKPRPLAPTQGGKGEREGEREGKGGETRIVGYVESRVEQSRVE